MVGSLIQFSGLLEILTQNETIKLKSVCVCLFIYLKPNSSYHYVSVYIRKIFYFCPLFFLTATFPKIYPSIWWLQSSCPFPQVYCSQSH